MDPASVHAVVLTHAHLDHTGYLPRLVAQGFRGRIFCTPGTADLVPPRPARCGAAAGRRRARGEPSRLLEARSRAAALHGGRRVPRAHAAAARRLRPPVPVASGIEVSFTPTGHLLGAAAVTMVLGGRTTSVFGGDLGRYDRPVLRDPEPVPAADVLLVESTYGDRLHEPDDQGARFGAIVRETVARGGKVVIPAFAIGRVEEVLYWLKRLEEAQRDPGGAGVRRQPDGGRGARLLRQARGRARRRHARRGQAAGKLRDAALPDGVVAAAVGGARRRRRRRRSSSRRAAWRPAAACCTT